MRTHRRPFRARRGAAIAGATALAVLATLAPTAAAGADAVEWVEVTHSHVSGQDSYLYDSWTTGEEVWNVGTRRADFGGVFEWRTLVQRCVGSSCVATYPRDFEAPPYTSNHLQSVSGTSSSDVWAVGHARYPGGSPGIVRPTIHHWDGSTWTVVPNPVESGALYGVSAVAPDDVWAVGAEGSFAPQAQLVLHWDGTSWTRMPFTVGGNCAPWDYLFDIAADGKRPMVIGECRVDGGQPEPMVASYRNGSWQREAVPLAVPEDTNLHAVAWVGRQAWVGGGGWTDAVAARMKKRTWADRSGDFTGTIFGIEGRSAKDLWAVGTGGTSIRLALHWNGRTWTSTDAGAGGGWLETVAITDSGTPWAAGQNGGQSLILRRG